MPASLPVDSGRPCPDCQSPTVATEQSSLAWCPRCEWGLDHYDESAAPWRGTRALSRWGYHRGFHLDQKLRDELAARPEAASERGRSEMLLMALSAVIVLVSCTCFVLALAVWWYDELLLPLRFFASIGLFIVGWWLRPRFGREPRGPNVLPDGAAPQLRQLVSDVAHAVGSPKPDLIVLDEGSAEIAVARVGLRQRSVLVIGLPLWLVLMPEQRIAALGHEFGHIVNRDPLRATFTAPALRVFESAVEWTGGHRPWSQFRERMEDDRSIIIVGHNMSLGQLVTYTLLATINRIFAAAQLAVEAVAMPDHRRAEYAADLLGREVAGSAAMRDALDRLTVMELVLDGLVNDVESAPPSEWAERANARARLLAPQRRTLRQATRREADLWSSHPPAGMRAALIDALPTSHGRVRPDAAVFARIDAELANWYSLTHRTLLGTREFAG